MKCRTLAIVVVTLVSIATISAPAVADRQDDTEQPEMTPEMQAEMEAWMKLAHPGPHHGHLAPYVGKWKGEIKMWMAPEAEPMIEVGTADVSAIMEGRFLEWKHSGNFGGMPFEGRAVDGFNNGDERYETIWFDNFGTLILFYQGTCSDEGKTRVLTTEFSDPMQDGMIHNRVVYTWLDDDHFTYESYMKRGDSEFRNMEIRYERLPSTEAP